MAINVRRVVTGLDENGKATVSFDDNLSEVAKQRPGIQSALIWTTDSYPLEVEGSEDNGRRTVERHPSPRGTIFRVVEFGPDNPSDNHVTQTIDYAVVISGEIDMELDEGREVHLKQGDVLVQRATIHNWRNRGTEPCLIAFVLIDTGQG